MSEFCQLVPPGGWMYKEEKTNTTLAGMDRNDLISSMVNHRKSNGIKLGDPEMDLNEQIEKNHPGFKVR